MAVHSSFEAIETVARGVARPICGAETTSGSMCRAAPMASIGNGRCVQHGGHGRVSGAGADRHPLEQSEEPPRGLAETIDRLGVDLDVVASLAAELPLAARQQFVPELRVLAVRALGAYHELLAQNRADAKALTSRKRVRRLAA